MIDGKLKIAANELKTTSKLDQNGNVRHINLIMSHFKQIAKGTPTEVDFNTILKIIFKAYIGKKYQGRVKFEDVAIEDVLTIDNLKNEFKCKIFKNPKSTYMADTST
jgi:hypothetical protein